MRISSEFGEKFAQGRSENPCVGGSIPSLSTESFWKDHHASRFFVEDLASQSRADRYTARSNDSTYRAKANVSALSFSVSRAFCGARFRRSHSWMSFFCTLLLYAILSTNLFRGSFGAFVVEDCKEGGGVKVHVPPPGRRNPLADSKAYCNGIWN